MGTGEMMAHGSFSTCLDLWWVNLMTWHVKRQKNSRMHETKQIYACFKTLPL